MFRIYFGNAAETYIPNGGEKICSVAHGRRASSEQSKILCSRSSNFPCLSFELGASGLTAGPFASAYWEDLNLNLAIRVPRLAYGAVRRVRWVDQSRNAAEPVRAAGPARMHPRLRQAQAGGGAGPGPSCARGLGSARESGRKVLNRVLGIQYLDPWRACTLFLLLRRLSSEETV
jgi:hypothetical protein